MKLTFQIGNDPITYTLKTEVEHPPQTDLRTPREIFQQEVQTE